MNIKVTAISTGILVALSTAASAQTPAPLPTPPSVPSIYASGPAAPLLNTTNLSAAERSAYALYEGVMQITEATIHSTSCKKATYDVDIYADGSVANPSIFNQVKVSASDGSGAPQFTLQANLNNPVTGRGQQVAVSLTGPGFLGSSRVASFAGTYAYNNVNNMLVSLSTNIGIVGINGGLPDNYSSSVIKDFYRGELTDSGDGQYYNIFDWGLQSISKLGYPVEKWWQRSESHRDDGTIARTVFVKDRLVGASSCRIILDTTGQNNQNVFWQGSSIGGTGVLRITTDSPSVAVEPDSTLTEAWSQYPFVH